MTTDLTGQVAVIPKPGSFVARGIAAVTDSHVYHMVVHAGAGQVVSADPEGVRLRLVSEWPDAIWSRYALKGLQAAAVADYARSQVGKPYAFADDALIGCERLLRIRFPRWVRKAYEDDGQLQCSQLATASLLHGGIDPFPGDPDKLGDVAPGDFEALFVRNGWNAPADFGPRVSFPW